MKTLMRIAAAFALAGVVFMSGCGQSDEEKKLSETRSQSQALATEASQTTEALVAELQKLKQENRALQASVNEAVTRQEVILSRIEMEANQLQQQAGTVKQSIAKQIEAEARSGGGIVKFLLWGLLIIVILAVVFAIVKMFKPKPFDDEDEDDFSSFDDDDFGFDDEDDFGDDDASDKGKKGDKKDDKS